MSMGAMVLSLGQFAAEKVFICPFVLCLRSEVDGEISATVQFSKIDFHQTLQQRDTQTLNLFLQSSSMRHLYLCVDLGYKGIDSHCTQHILNIYNGFNHPEACCVV